MKSSQGRAATPWKRDSKSGAGKEPSSISTRAPHRRLMFSRAMSAIVPSQWTLPFSARTPPRFSRRISSATRDSNPNKQGTVSVMAAPPFYHGLLFLDVV